MEKINILQEAAQHNVITDEGMFFPYGLATVGLSKKLQLEYILFVKKLSKDKKIILVHEGRPIFEIAISYNSDDFENLFQMKFYYFREGAKDEYTPIRIYEIRRSIGVLRYWTAANLFDMSDIPTENFATERDKFMFLTRDAIEYSVEIMRADEQNTLHSLSAGSINGLDASLEGLLPCLLNWYEEYSTIVEFDPDTYLNQINIRRRKLLDEKERLNAIVIDKKDRLKYYSLALLNVERYYNCYTELLEDDEIAALKMKESSKSRPNK